MASLREVIVRLVGQETVSDAGKKSESALDKLGGAVKKLGGLLGVTFGAAAVANFFKNSVLAAADFEKSQNRLIATSKLTGVALEDLRAVAERGKTEFGLNASLANDLSIELAKLASKAGDVGKAGPGLAAFLDLGAARGLSAAETLKAVQQSILGIDEGTDKLFNKNPSVLYKEYADKIGTTAGKLTDQQKAQALLTAALEDGLKVQGSYGEYLGTFAGRLDSTKNAYETLKIAVGQAILSTGDAATATGTLAAGLGDLAKWVEANETGFAVMGQAMLAVVSTVVKFVGWLGEMGRIMDIVALEAGTVWAKLGVKIAAVVGGLLKSIGGFFENSRILGAVFGEGVTLAGEKMAKAGRAMQENAERDLRNIEAERKRHFNELVYGVTRSEADQTGAVREGGIARANVRRELTDEEKKELDEHAKWLKSLEEKTEEVQLARYKRLKDEPKFWGDIKDAVRTMGNEVQRTLALNSDVNLELATSVATAKVLTTETAKTAAESKKKADEEKAAAEKAKEALDSTLGLGRALLDVGLATGTVSAEMGNVLNSVMNIGASLARMGIDPIGGMVGVISGLANVITGFGNSEAHRRYVATMNQNRDAVERLTREVGNLNLGASGRAFAATRGAVQATIAAQAAGKFGAGPVGDIKALQFFEAQLRAAGVSMEEAKQILGDLGLGWNTVPEFRGLLGAFAEGLGEVELGGFGPDFESQLQATEMELEVFGGTDDSSKLQGLARLARRFSPALARALESPDPKKALQALFAQMTSGGLTAADLGDLNGRQFLTLLQKLLPLVGSAPLSITGTGGPKAKLDFGVDGIAGFDPTKEGKGVGGLPLVGTSGVFEPVTGGAGGGSGSGGIVVSGNTFNFGPVAVSPDGQPIDEAGADLAAMVARELAKKLALQNTALGVAA